MNVGDVAPDFETVTESGESFRLSDHRGHKVVLYFYPKDNTPGCAAEACSLRDALPVFSGENIRVFGVSGGSAKSHKRFKEKYDLNFPLLMDEDHSIAKLYGVYVPKKLAGREYLGIHRITFLIDENGLIDGIYGGPHGIEKVKTKQHAEQIAKYWKLPLGK